VTEILSTLPDFQSPVPVQDLADLSGGSVQRALDWADPSLLEFRQALLSVLSQSQWRSTLLSKQIAECVDQAGKEAALRRDRFRLIVSCAEEFYRTLMKRLAGKFSTSDAAMESAVSKTVEHWLAGVEGAARCIDRCLDAEREVTSNANMNLLVECWVDDLATHANRRQGAAIRVY
jgi:DNA polymerase-3 subunit delta'